MNKYRALRLAYNETQREYASRLGIPISTIQKWELGLIEPNVLEKKALFDPLVADPELLSRYADLLQEERMIRAKKRSSPI